MGAGSENLPLETTAWKAHRGRHTTLHNRISGTDMFVMFLLYECYQYQEMDKETKHTEKKTKPYALKTEYINSLRHNLSR